MSLVYFLFYRIRLTRLLEVANIRVRMEQSDLKSGISQILHEIINFFPSLTQRSKIKVVLCVNQLFASDHCAGKLFA